MKTFFTLLLVVALSGCENMTGDSINWDCDPLDCSEKCDDLGYLRGGMCAGEAECFCMMPGPDVSGEDCKQFEFRCSGAHTVQRCMDGAWVDDIDCRYPDRPQHRCHGRLMLSWDMGDDRASTPFNFYQCNTSWNSVF